MSHRGVSLSQSVGLLLLVLVSCSRPIRSLPIDGAKGNGVPLPPCGNSPGNEEYDGANGAPCSNPDGSVRTADTAANSDSVTNSDVPRINGQSPGTFAISSGQGFSSITASPGPSSSAFSASPGPSSSAFLASPGQSGGPSPAAGVSLGSPVPYPTINQFPPAVLQGNSPPQGNSGGDGSSGSTGVNGGANVTPYPTPKQVYNSQLEGSSGDRGWANDSPYPDTNQGSGSKDSSGIKGFPGDPDQP